MNAAHFHLTVNHLPIILPIAGLIVLLTGYFTKSEIVKRTAYFLFILGAIFTMPAFGSGEGAEEFLEKMQGIDRKFIHEHEEKAEIFAIFSYLLGAISLISLWLSWKKNSFAKYFSYVIAILALVAIFLAKQTGTSGGEIRHSEIRTETGVLATPNEENEQTPEH